MVSTFLSTKANETPFLTSTVDTEIVDLDIMDSVVLVDKIMLTIYDFMK